MSNTLLFVSCNQKELLDSEELCKVDVRFVWDKAPEASPEGMTLLFYPLDTGGEFWRFEISGREGGTIEIPWGNYTMIALNNDLPGIILKDMPYSTSSVSVREMPRSQSFASPSGIVYEGDAENLTILPDRINSIPDRINSIIECHPDSISTIYNIVIDEITGIERVKAAQALLDGCSGGILLSTLIPLPSSVVIQVPLDIDYDQFTFTGATTGFPSNPATAIYKLILRLEYFGGGGYEKSFEITEQVKNSFYPNNVYINIKGLDLPEEPTIEPDEVGIKVDVDGWKVIEINLDSSNY